jgi:hypothetical protein
VFHLLTAPVALNRCYGISDQPGSVNKTRDTMAGTTAHGRVRGAGRLEAVRDVGSRATGRQAAPSEGKAGSLTVRSA